MLPTSVPVPTCFSFEDRWTFGLLVPVAVPVPLLRAPGGALSACRWPFFISVASGFMVGRLLMVPKVAVDVSFGNSSKNTSYVSDSTQFHDDIILIKFYVNK